MRMWKSISISVVCGSESEIRVNDNIMLFTIYVVCSAALAIMEAIVQLFINRRKKK